VRPSAKGLLVATSERAAGTGGRSRRLRAGKGLSLDSLRRGRTGSIIPGRFARRLAMSETVRELLRVFDSLSLAEQHEVGVELLRRCTPDGDLPDMALDEVAAELFRAYDAEEADRAAT